MSDYRSKLVNRIEESLINSVDPDTRELVMRKVLSALNDFEVMERCTDLAVYDDQNERLLKRYRACMMVDGKSEKTIYAYTRSLSRFFDFIGRPVTEMSAYDVRYYLACEKERGVADVTLENTRSYVTSFFQWLTDEEVIPKNPCAVLKPIKCIAKEPKAFSAVELDAIRHACRNEKERAIIETLASSGVRVNELASMDVNDIDFSAMTVLVTNGKGGKQRTTYINEVARLHIQKYLLTRTDNSPALFCNKNHGRIAPGGIRHILKEIGKRAEVENVHPHRFRRTLATDLASRGMPVQEVQTILGHSGINTTMKYVCIDKHKVQSSYQQYIA